MSEPCHSGTALGTGRIVLYVKKKWLNGGKETEILRVSHSVSCAYISLVPPQMLF